MKEAKPIVTVYYYDSEDENAEEILFEISERMIKELIERETGKDVFDVYKTFDR